MNTDKHGWVCSVLAIFLLMIPYSSLASGADIEFQFDTSSFLRVYPSLKPSDSGKELLYSPKRIRVPIGETRIQSNHYFKIKEKLKYDPTYLLARMPLRRDKIMSLDPAEPMIFGGSSFGQV